MVSCSQVVSTITQICRVAERVFDYQQHYDYLMESAIEVRLLPMTSAVTCMTMSLAADCDGHKPTVMRNAFSITTVMRNAFSITAVMS